MERQIALCDFGVKDKQSAWSCVGADLSCVRPATSTLRMMGLCTHFELSLSQQRLGALIARPYPSRDGRTQERSAPTNPAAVPLMLDQAKSKHLLLRLYSVHELTGSLDEVRRRAVD